MRISRRDLIQTIGIIGGVSVAGCSSLTDGSVTGIVLQIEASERGTVGLTVFDPEADRRSEATLFSRLIELAEEDVGGVVERTFDDAFESERALVEVRTQSHVEQFFYYPDCPQEDSDESLRVTVDTETGSVDYTTGCS